MKYVLAAVGTALGFVGGVWIADFINHNLDGWIAISSSEQLSNYVFITLIVVVPTSTLLCAVVGWRLGARLKRN